MSLGWDYQPRYFCPSTPDKCSGCEAEECERCGEQLAWDPEWDYQEPFCWACEDPVPAGWEEAHVRAEAIIYWSDRNPESHTGWTYGSRYLGYLLASERESVPSWWEGWHEDAEAWDEAWGGKEDEAGEWRDGR